MPNTIDNVGAVTVIARLADPDDTPWVATTVQLYVPAVRVAAKTTLLPEIAQVPPPLPYVPPRAFVPVNVDASDIVTPIADSGVFMVALVQMGAEDGVNVTVGVGAVPLIVMAISAPELL